MKYEVIERRYWDDTTVVVLKSTSMDEVAQYLAQFKRVGNVWFGYYGEYSIRTTRR